MECFVQLYKLVPDTKLRNFRFHYLHRIIFCADKLYRWGLVDSPICIYCNEQYETMEHLFYLCPTVRRFWEMFVFWFEAQTNTEITVNLENISLCNHEMDIVNVLINTNNQTKYICKKNY